MRRVAGLDLARGVACLGMIEAHAYDAYVDAPHRASAAFAATRFIALLPLPLFMVLAGMGVALRVERGREREEPSRKVRAELVRRGLQVVASGYALNVLYGLMDGATTLAVFLRFDVLHVIGASIVLLGLVLPGRARPVWAALLLALLCLLPSPYLQRAAVHAPAALRPWLVPFVDVAPYTLMPLLPLASWCGLGAAVTPFALRHPGRLALAAAVVAVSAFYGMQSWLAFDGVPPSRAHPAVWLNAVDLGARALVVIAGALLLFPRLRPESRVVGVLLALGCGSLRVYALHLPFAYGAPGRPLRAVPDMSVAAATPWVLGLMALTFLLLRATDRVRDRWRAKRYTAPAS